MSQLKHYAPSLLATLFVVAFFYLPNLAGGPQNPDGGELLLTAKYGGVLHPPGFPLQSWVNLFFHFLLPYDVHTNLLWGNLFFHLINCFLFSFLFQKYRLSGFSSLLLILIYSLTPVVWSMAIQVEKYTFLVTLFLLTILVWKQWLLKLKATQIYWVAFFWGLSLGHHYFALALWPYYAQLFFSKRIPQKAKIISVIVLSSTVFILYSSLFFLTKEGVYPDWGKLQSYSDLLAHMMRKGVTIDRKLFLFLHEDNISAVRIFLFDYMPFFFLPLLFSLFGFYQLLKHQKRDIPLFLSFLTAITLLITFNYQPEAGNEYWPAYLRRYTIIVLPSYILILGIGLKLIKRFPLTIHTLALTFMLIIGTYIKDDFNMKGPSVMDLYQQSLGELIPHSAFYLGSSDEQILYGIEQADHRRFPIRSSKESWYLETVIPLLEPRLTPKDPSLRPTHIHLPSLAKMLIDNNALVATTMPAILGESSFRRGFVWFNRPLKTEDNSTKILCEKVRLIQKPLQKRFHEYEWFLAVKFRSALAYNYSQRTGKGSRSSRSLARDLERHCSIK